MTSREERLQQRLRGPQRRQLDEYDDDFNFGIIVPPAPAATTSNIPLAIQPAAISSTLPLRIPTQQTPIHPPEVAEVLSSLPISQRLSSQSANDANTSAKRRKLDTDPPLSARSTRSSQRTQRATISEEEQLKTTNTSHVSIEQTQSPEIVEQTIISDPRRATPTPRAIEIVSESPADAPGSGRRSRTIVSSVIPATSQLQTIQQSSPDAEIESSPVAQRRAIRRAVPRKEPSPDLSQETRNHTIEATPTGDDDLDELSPEGSDKLNLDHHAETTPVPQRRRKRKTPPPRELSLDLSQEVLGDISGPNGAEDDVDELSPGSALGSADKLDEEEEAAEIDDEQAAMLLRRNQGRRSSMRFATASLDPVPDHEVPAESTPAKRRKVRKRIEASPVQQRQPKVAIKKGKPQAARKNRTRSERLGSPIPVTVFRLTKSMQHGEEIPDADILNYRIPRPQKGGPNAVDVLAQVCREVVLSSLEGLENIKKRSTDPALKREFKTKCDAFESLGRELETRFLEHTTTLDHNTSLRRRLRDEQKKKLDLREQISQVRAEREQIALRMDEIRIKHENETRKALGQYEVNSALHDIELAIDLGKSNVKRNSARNTDEMIGTELLLKRIASQVSNKSDSGGLLRQLKEANAFFERTALVLEGRRI